MSLFKKKQYLFTLLISVFLVGCSFQPAWVAKNQKAEILWERVDFKEAKTSNEFRLNRYLASRLGKAADAELFLKYELFTEAKRSALSFDGKAFRIRIHGVVKFSLIQNSKNSILFTSSVRDSAAYSDARLAVTDEASERDAYARLMVLLGDRIVDKLLIYKTF